MQVRRQITLDTETTGLDVHEGHRVIEIGAVEMRGEQQIAKFETLLNPGRRIDAGAYAVHGICEAMLEGAPTFKDVADRFIQFIDGAEVLIHNAQFDREFMDMELQAAGYFRLGDYCQITCTLDLARTFYPQDTCSLDRLCDRFSIDRTHRVKHRALLDAELLALVYRGMVQDAAA